VFNPTLLLCPGLVLSNNNGGIIALSEKTKVLGIQMGMPEFKCRMANCPAFAGIERNLFV